MPMVSESSDAPDRSFPIWSGTRGSLTTTRINGLHRTQTGYRSRRLTTEEELGIAPNSLSGNVESLLGFYDDLSEGYHGPSALKRPSRAFVVNDRDATKTIYHPKGFNATVIFARYGVPRDPLNYQGCLGFTGFTSTVIPSLPSPSVIESMAGGLMRRAKPSVAGFNLARFAAEQRDAPALFKASNYRPRNYKQAAGAYLNYLFGVKPTGSDLVRLADLVIGADTGVRRLINVEKIIQKSRRGILLYQTSSSGTTVQKNSLDYTAYRAFTLGGCLKMAGSYLAPGGGSEAVLAPIFNYSYTIKQVLTQFSTWEFFVPKPAEIHGRLDTYKERAERLVSSARITEGDIYELAPWTWLADWFVDIGGLLQYQRDVVDNQIVASANGYSVWEDFTGLVSYSGRKYDATGVSPAYAVLKDTFTPFQTSIQWRRHKRRGANPYSIGPTWSFSTQQWAILGALGLSRGPGLPIKRG